jgi:hypothetical protein
VYRISVPADLTIVDPSGRYSESLGGVDMDFTLNCSDVGKITGNGTASAYEMGVSINLSFTFTGTVSGSGGTTRLSLSMKGNGNARYQGQSFPVTFTATQKGNFDRALDEFVGTAKVKVCLKEGGRNYCENASETMAFDVPGSEVGDWTSDVTVASDSKNRLTGNGLARLASSGRQFNFKVTGTYTPKRDETKLKLAATDKSGANVQVTGQASGGVLVPAKSKLSGKLLGQSFKR